MSHCKYLNLKCSSIVYLETNFLRELRVLMLEDVMSMRVLNTLALVNLEYLNIGNTGITELNTDPFSVL